MQLPLRWAHQPLITGSSNIRRLPSIPQRPAPPEDKSCGIRVLWLGRGAVKAIEQELKNAGIEVLEPGLQVRYKPYEKDLEKCRKLGEQLAAAAKER